MKISFDELMERDEKVALIIHSLDGSLYQVTVVNGEQEQLLVGKNGKPFRENSLAGARRALRDLPVASLTLRHSSAYDEMIGQPTRDTNTMEIPLNLEMVGGGDIDKS